MAVKRFFEEIDQKYAWSFISVLLAVIFGSIAVYKEFIEDTHPELRYDVLTNTSVLDVREQLSNLNILFDGIDIRKQSLSLRVISVRVSNGSSKDILKGHYDINAPVGIHVSEGKVIKTELVGASSEYLSNSISFTAGDDQTIFFSEVILEAKESFTLKLLVLHPEGRIPNLSAVGKVAGIKTIEVREAFRESQEKPFFSLSFRGSFFVQVVRLITYTIGTIIIITAIVAPSVIISSKLDKRRRRKSVQEFRAITSVDLDESDELIFTAYVRHGEREIQRMYSLVSDPNHLARSYAQYIGYLDRLKQRRDWPPGRRSEPDGAEIYIRHRLDVSMSLGGYLNTGLIQETDSGVIADEHLANTLEHFVRFLRNKGIIPPNDDIAVRRRGDGGDVGGD